MSPVTSTVNAEPDMVVPLTDKSPNEPEGPVGPAGDSPRHKSRDPRDETYGSYQDLHEISIDSQRHTSCPTKFPLQIQLNTTKLHLQIQLNTTKYN